MRRHASTYGREPGILKFPPHLFVCVEALPWTSRTFPSRTRWRTRLETTLKIKVNLSSRPWLGKPLYSLRSRPPESRPAWQFFLPFCVPFLSFLLSSVSVSLSLAAAGRRLRPYIMLRQRRTKEKHFREGIIFILL